MTVKRMLAADGSAANLLIRLLVGGVFFSFSLRVQDPSQRIGAFLIHGINHRRRKTED